MNKKEEAIIEKANTPEGQKLLNDFQKNFIKSVGSGRYECRDLSDKQKAVMKKIWVVLFPEEVEELRKSKEAKQSSEVLENMKVLQVKSALRALLDHYVNGANSGDWGHWNPEQEDVVRSARKALEV